MGRSGAWVHYEASVGSCSSSAWQEVSSRSGNSAGWQGADVKPHILMARQEASIGPSDSTAWLGRAWLGGNRGALEVPLSPPER